ncbi:Phosphatidylinositol N-acetyglucosaminlytransferase subunit P-related [Zea mays]|uniref:Phosphatidylinositol N-acetyglucosaminlytransferase subunit P-related n=1 Tax=Zea mays TaxID=4577 RepID=A0A1D6K842_MAIZE|nr:Phosphatidylinositol N-acetyglucosaminlytransferase subunit P-related [Zea mays]
MGKRGHRRSASQDDDNVGCVWGLMRMLYFRRDPKLLLDAKQLSGRHAFREVSGRGHSAKRPNDFDGIEEDGNIEDRTLQKPTVKNLMEDELEKLMLLKKFPNDEVQRRKADLGIDVSLDTISEHTNKSTDNSYHQAGISTPSTPSMDYGVLNYTEEYNLESVLVNFLGEIYSCHNECPHSDCKNKNELCPSLKSLIHKKVNELNNLPHNIGRGQSQEGSDAKPSDQNNLYNTMAAQSKQFKDALEILGSNSELFVKLLQKPNQHIADSIQQHENSKVSAGLEPDKIHGQTNFVGGRGSSKQHPLATKEQAKERKYMFFWRKSKSNRRQMLDATDGAQTVSKIVILKPNPERGINQKAATARTLHQQPCTSNAPGCSGRENSKFSIKEVKKRFRFVTGERSERNLSPAEDLQGDPRKIKDSVVAINKYFRHLPEGSLANKSASDIENGIKPFISSKQKNQNGSITEISGHIVAPKGASVFYEEARRHLSEMLKGNDCSINYPEVQISKSLEGILSLPHGNVSTTGSSLRGKDYLDPSPGETDVYDACEVEREECTQERSQSQEDFGSIAHCTCTTVDDQVTVREGYYTNEAQEGPRHAHDEPDTLYIEGLDKFICRENIRNEESSPAEQSRDDEILEEINQGKEHVKMSLASVEGIDEKLGQQEPETPEPRASAKLISDGSPNQSDEKQERPSPVSVLESSFEDIGSPDCINKKECELHGLQRTLYFPDNEPDVNVLWEDKNVRLDYIKLVLELSELCAEQNLEVWYLEDELISPCLFEELQSQGDQTDDRMLLFDCICEALTEIQERYFRLSSWLTFLKHDIRTPPTGENLITEVDRYVNGYIIQYSLPSTLEQTIKRDLEVQTWMNIRSKTEGIIMEMWEFVLDELIDETVSDLWI